MSINYNQLNMHVYRSLLNSNPNDPVTWHMVQQQQQQLQYGDAVSNEIRIRVLVGEKGRLGCGVCKGLVPGLTVQVYIMRVFFFICNYSYIIHAQCEMRQSIYLYITHKLHSLPRIDFYF